MFLILLFFLAKINVLEINKIEKQFAPPDYVSQYSVRMTSAFRHLVKIFFFFFFDSNSLLKQINSENYFNVAEVCPLAIQKQNTCLFLAVLSFVDFVHKGNRSTTGEKKFRTHFYHFGDSSVYIETSMLDLA